MATLLEAYRSGYFPMPTDGKKLGWFSPDPRAVLVPGRLQVSRSLNRSLDRFKVTVDKAFAEVVVACADPGRPHGWINKPMAAAYISLHEAGFAHSVEAWEGDDLVGGLYGVSIGGLFAGESMFHKRSDASKVALVRLAEIMGVHPEGGDAGALIDVQWSTPHLESLGVLPVRRNAYARLLSTALDVPCPAWERKRR